MHTIKLRRSWLLAAMLVISHAAAMAVIVIVDMPPWLKLLIFAALFLNFLHGVRRTALLLAPASAVAIEVASDNRLRVQTRNGDWIECEVMGSTYVASFFTVLNVRHIERRAVRHIVLMPDGVDGEDFRKLRVWLRWQRDAHP